VLTGTGSPIIDIFRKNATSFGCAHLGEEAVTLRELMIQG
jgi:hypothetical protein